VTNANLGYVDLALNLVLAMQRLGHRNVLVSWWAHDGRASL
jgi:hypothetical protein